MNGNTADLALTLNPNAEGPYLLLTSPSDYSEYATLIELEGYAVNSSSDSSTSELNTIVSYSIPGTSISGTAALNTANGFFSKTIDVSSLDGSKTIEITVADLNSIETSVVVNIVKPTDGGDISGFTVTPGNQQVTISWAPVPGAESYSIFESRYGQTIPDDEISSNSYTWTGLANGEKYTFQLTAYLPENAGVNAVSAVISQMPMSTSTLRPWVKSRTRSALTIEWTEIPKVTEYIVERSISPDGPWSTKQIITAHEFTDTTVEENVVYYYRITPDNFSEINSSYISASADYAGYYEYDAFPTENIYDVEKEGDLIYIGEYYGLRIIDVSNPEHPVERGFCTTGYQIRDIAVDGTNIWVTGHGGLSLIDASDLDEPVVLKLYDTIPGHLLTIDGDTCYLIYYPYDMTFTSIFHILDISDTANIIEYSSTTIDYSDPAKLEVIDNLVYYLDGYQGLQIIDVSEKETPVLRDTLSPYATDIEFRGNYAFITAVLNGMNVVDITDPDNISIVANYPTDSYAMGIDINGNLAYIAAEEEFILLDISDPLNPVYKTEVTSMGKSIEVFQFEPYIYIADEYFGFQILDSSNRVIPTIENSWCPNDMKPNRVEIQGEYAYTNYSNNIYITDISNPDAPIDKGYCRVDSSVSDIAAAGNYLYATGYKLDIINIEDPSKPFVTGTVEDFDSSNSLFIAGDYIFVVGSSKLRIFDVSNPSSPIEMGSCSSPSSGTDIVLSGNYAYIATISNGLQIADISDKENPVIIGNCNIDPDTPSNGGAAKSVTISGNYAFLTNYIHGLCVVDISDPVNPELVADCETLNTAAGERAVTHTASGSYAYLLVQNGTDDTRDLKIIDISKPLDPRIIETLDFPSDWRDHHDIVIRGSRAYAAVAGSGLYIIDLYQ